MTRQRSIFIRRNQGYCAYTGVCQRVSSLIITTNIEFGKWGTVLGDDKLAVAIIDRLFESGRLVEFNGASHRMEHALMLGKEGERP